MSSYFDEHNCEFGETPNNFLHLVRLLLDSGLAAEFQIEYEQLFGDGRSHPPASKSFVEKLKTITDFPKDRQCPVCMKEFEEGDIGKQLPCQHLFHASCISPWLNITNTCPVCRDELPTDDPDYEEYRKQQERIKQRKADLETLHDSMFG
ncbi:E3 ubiquitin-protein ligase RNF181-like isoform X4 [Centruroides vittatus]|uniref:E3 ubiquitin-protein ligase RNF181-like isoform X2 n=1 Tax=Centruroides sculpturatus TaxID=218467 RepID=UPI000C6CC0B3|nr:E3 ubiquitin-protein ligase RNF181-like isoform X2 [Centruroides sculpturatus]